MIVYIKQHLYQFTLVLLLTTFNCFVIAPAASTVQAQTTTAAQLTPEQWKAVEGIFQNQRNKDMYVQFTAKENFLVAKLLWNNNELKLYPETELNFVSKEEVEGGLAHMNFTKDSTGTVMQATLNGNNVWIRAKDYKPIIKNEMVHTAAQLKPYEGLYQLQRDKERFIQFTEKENKLILKQHWDGTEIPFVPETETDFFSKQVPLFSLVFVKDDAGNITQALVNKRDKWDKVKKLIPTSSDLKALEGKYQFKDDPDNYIQLIAKKNTLVVKQLWDNKEMVLEPYTATYFFSNQQWYPLLVTKDSTGAVTQVLVLGMDVFVKVKE